MQWSRRSPTDLGHGGRVIDHQPRTNVDQPHGANHEYFHEPGVNHRH
ncbi:MAG: hypothetical protein H0V96_08320 [Acidimicrobiia bacterium]|nr:hypothetical protein [Acidimicrobiia bacterium]